MLIWRWIKNFAEFRVLCLTNRLHHCNAPYQPSFLVLKNISQNAFILERKLNERSLQRFKRGLWLLIPEGRILFFSPELPVGSSHVRRVCRGKWRVAEDIINQQVYPSGAL